MTYGSPDPRGHWTCPHGHVTGFFPVPGHPLLIEHRSCGICCEEISEHISQNVVGELPKQEATP